MLKTRQHKNHLFLFIAFGLLIALIAQPRGYADITVEKIESAAIAKNTMGIASLQEVLVYTPPDYETTTERYPVIYWLPGWTNPANNLPVPEGMDEAIQARKVPPVIVVSLNSGIRAGGGIFTGITFLNSHEFGNWEDFLIQELIPFIDKSYRTIPDWHRRALMGWSAGGYSALILPLLHPNIWGVVGTNDACFWMACSIFDGMPEGGLVDVYRNAGFLSTISIQLGTAISPNPNVPLRFDWPKTADIREKWDAYCLQNPETIVQHRKTLINLLEIVLIVPEESAGSCRGRNLQTIQQMETAGIPVTRLNWAGGHSTDHHERFIALADRVVKAMPKGISVDPKGKLATSWSQIKSMK